eukprot:TRINITY_DN63275_c1_g2_i1.p1 TRINITY_DN63275_c1_g2~~TRINITY_DN63275_c1_g2_i1.p1  ORF type:complete len:170 (+),score=2.56 TRINITY_DN63275_c1_g2_i1:118-627(+)
MVVVICPKELQMVQELQNVDQITVIITRRLQGTRETVTHPGCYWNRSHASNLTCDKSGAKNFALEFTPSEDISEEPAFMELARMDGIEVQLHLKDDDTWVNFFGYSRGYGSNEPGKDQSSRVRVEGQFDPSDPDADWYSFSVELLWAPANALGKVTICTTDKTPRARAL